MTNIRPKRAAPGDSGVAHALSSLRALVAVLARAARAVEDRTGITNAQLFLLRELAGKPGMSINELAASAMTTQSTASILVTRLERAGLVRRVRAAADARRVGVSLTAKGRRTAARAPEPPTGRLISALEELQPAQLRDLARSVDVLLAQLQAPGASDAPLFEPVRQRGAAPKRSKSSG